MDRETARQEVRSRISCKDYLTKSKSGLYDCPYCGSGSGPHGTGALKVYDTNTWYCHACHKGGDVIDLYQRETGADYNTALSLLAQEIGVTIDPYRPDAKEAFSPVPRESPSGGRISDSIGQGNTDIYPRQLKPLRAAQKAPQRPRRTTWPIIGSAGSD